MKNKIIAWLAAQRQSRERAVTEEWRKEKAKDDV